MIVKVKFFTIIEVLFNAMTDLVHSLPWYF